MATIEVRCTIKLPDPVVLACQKDTSYPPIQWQLANGDTVSIEMEVPEDQIKSQYRMHSSKGNWFVNSKVRAVALSLVLHNVSNDDVERLHARHATAKTLRARFKTDSGPLDLDYQEAPELGQRIVCEIVESINLVLRFIRDNYGQHWLSLISADEEKPQNFLNEVRAEWREAANPWQQLLLKPPIVAIGPVYVGAWNRYLETSDWKAIQQMITRNEGPPDAFWTGPLG
ncbi:MAG: hypothetical protein DMG82_04170 [Acidobacteria bacterium]|nr:MAG: hypothetical protein DMG82_04170 [Acidobacteriota bacterium]PYX44391.1 MAG: hypothetical protein DMG83_13955 [Acidobacteriota bacterium]